MTCSNEHEIGIGETPVFRMTNGPVCCALSCTYELTPLAARMPLRFLKVRLDRPSSQSIDTAQLSAMPLGKRDSLTTILR